MCGFFIVDVVGGSSRVVTLLTFLIHFINPLFAISNYCAWVMYERLLLGETIVTAYITLSIIAAFFYLFLASVFYMWAWRFPDPEEMSKRRRIYGILVNLIFSDIPLFVIGVKILWDVQLVTAIQGISFVISCISFAYSAVRVWIFVMIKLIKVRAPTAEALPHLSSLSAGAADTKRLGQQPISFGDESFIPRVGGHFVGGAVDERQNNSSGAPFSRQTPGDIYWQSPRCTDDRYGGDRFSTPGRPSWPRI